MATQRTFDPKIDNCGNCKHWCKEPHWNFADLHDCQRIHHLQDCQMWDENATGDGPDNILKPEYKDDKAFAQDASGYSAKLVTHATFGCVHHERG